MKVYKDAVRDVEKRKERRAKYVAERKAEKDAALRS